MTGECRGGGMLSAMGNARPSSKIDSKPQRAIPTLTKAWPYDASPYTMTLCFRVVLEASSVRSNDVFHFEIEAREITRGIATRNNRIVGSRPHRIHR